MNKNWIIAAVIPLLAITLIASGVIQVYADGHFFPISRPRLEASIGRQSNSDRCPVMNGYGMMGHMMDRRSVDYQQCQQHMGLEPQTTNQYPHQQCQQFMESSDGMSPAQCQEMIPH